MDRLLGKKTCTVGDRGRIKVPVHHRKILSPKTGTSIITTRGLDNCLAIYPLAEWETEEQKLRDLPYTVGNARLFAREMASSAEECTLDKQGRLLLSKDHRDWARIRTKEEVLILGVITHLEIFNPEVYRAYREGFGMTFENVAEEVDRYRRGESSE